MAFVEVAVNIDAILSANCQQIAIKTVFVKTKASDAYTAALKDFVDPQPVNFVFGNAGLSYGGPNFCKTGTLDPTAPAAPNGTFSFTRISPTPSTSNLSLNPTTGQINLGASDVGSYSVTYSPSSGVCLNPATATVIVNPIPTITLGDNTAVCIGTTSASISYSATTGIPNKYSIDFNAAAEAAGFVDITNSDLLTSPISITVPASAAATTYNGTLTVRTAAGCVSTGNSISVTINPNPNLIVTDPSAVCSPSTVDITADAVTDESTLPTGTSLSYWTNPEATSALSSPSTIATSGSYYIKATTNTTPACTDIKSVTVMVNITPDSPALDVDKPTCANA